MSDNKPGNSGNNQANGNQGGNGNHYGNDKPSDLGQKVDWMTYSHEALYKMIHEGVDLKAAGSAQADWAAVGKQLTYVHELLARAIAQSQQAWSGESADRAREALESVEKWALNTSDHAENVAKCIGDEIQHVQTARELMPAPVPPAPLPDPAVPPTTGTPVTPVAPTPVRSPLVSARRPLVDSVYEDRLPVDSLREPVEPLPTTTTPTSPFTGIDRVGAPAVDAVLTADASHRQAAEVMAMFQQNSYLVDRTVPSFVPPPNPVASTPPPVVTPPSGPSTPPDTSGGGGGPVVAGQPQPQPGREHTAPQQGRGGVGGRGGYAPGRLPMPVMGGPAGAGGGGGGGPLGSPAASPGVVGAERPTGHPGSVTSQFSSSKAVTPQSGMIGAAPMAAPPPVAGGAPGSNERNRPGYLEEEDNVFGVDRKAAPPVIGL
ncbi:PPE domain-containing protein [Saccharothrix variisporea]|uniref:PPE family protein n=1 Tax=Saccharothrix variisporea TaxID=543527 RepID=A0A495XBF8_9PSEU|nr:PPE domain-containing protein [Saccharothrix variisporea]RKT71342.1 PPE family protein [Saccharothrix variisporea]